MNLYLLKQEVKAQWKVQSFNKEKTKATCVAYIDARDAMDLLDKVVGPENWQDKYEIHGDKVICGLGIKCENEWVWKFDTGTEGDIEQEKAIFSDAFKRAAVKWGVGRFLYSMDIKYCNAKSYNDKGYPVDEKGERIWDLTAHFAKSEGKPAPKAEKATAEQVAGVNADLKTCPVCQKQHNGRYAKCLNCWKKDREAIDSNPFDIERM